MTATESIDTLIQILGQDNVYQRIAAQSQLVEHGTAAVEPLIRLLQSGTLKQQAHAIGLLGEIRDARAIEPLIHMLHAPHQLLRMNAAKALAAFNHPRIIDALLKSLDDQSELVQIWVVNTLGSIGDHRTIQPLITFLEQTPSPDVRYMVIRALGNLGDPLAVDHIVPFLNDDNRHVRQDAQDALIKLGYLAQSETQRE